MKQKRDANRALTESVKHILASMAGTMALAGMLMASAGAARAVSLPQAAADNSKTNQSGGATADQQKNNASDMDVTRQIRRSIMADKSLSVDAHNVKIITKNGQVTLRGPVQSQQEKDTVEAKANEVAGAANVESKITIASKQASN